ncbi:MAG: hypothetical protein ACFCUI_06865 [Bernardetiaceae bacterium]
METRPQWRECAPERILTGEGLLPPHQKRQKQAQQQKPP